MGTSSKHVRSRSPAGGAIALIIAKAGARKILPWWNEQPTGQMGHTLRNMFLALQHEVPMCYVMPPVGCQYQHTSGTTAGDSWRGVLRPSSFLFKWSQEGTRVRDERRDWPRWLSRYTTKGNPVYLAKVPDDITGPRWLWTTLAPPEMLATHLMRDGGIWVDGVVADYHQDTAGSVRAEGRRRAIVMESSACSLGAA